MLGVYGCISTCLCDGDLLMSSLRSVPQHKFVPAAGMDLFSDTKKKKRGNIVMLVHVNEINDFRFC